MRNEPKNCFNRTEIGSLYSQNYSSIEHLNNIWLNNEDLSCKQSNKGTKKALHVLCECEALDGRQAKYGQPKLDPEEDGQASNKGPTQTSIGNKIVEMGVMNRREKTQ